MLWNPHEKEYRNRDLKRMNLERLSDKKGSRITVDKIQQQWHNLATYFDRERMRMEGSKKSGAGTDEVYETKWPYYASMEFYMDKSIPDAAVSTLKHIAPVPQQKLQKLTLRIKKQNCGKLLQIDWLLLVRVKAIGNKHGSKDFRLVFSRHGNNAPRCSCSNKHH